MFGGPFCRLLFYGQLNIYIRESFFYIFVVTAFVHECPFCSWRISGEIYAFESAAKFRNFRGQSL